MVVKKYGGFVIREDGVVAFACDEGICDVIRRPERFDELFDGIDG
jgi:hypothetical protein